MNWSEWFVNKKIRIKTPMLRSNLCDYSNPYIVVKRTANLLAVAENRNATAEKDFQFKNNALLSISKNNNT